ncbi:aldo/keto reductase [uncultured Friedmanniella sp.]|uniref:aldo/keto reductase n=1 Tax=uncultured Friedmanniella sp. TaxID=335381 RepID=UPI0035CAFE47
MKFLEIDGLGQVSRVGLGTWQFGSREWGYGDGYASGPAHAIVARARELGVTLFDTAEVYGMGKSERILGEALGTERDQVVVASKIFPIAPFPPVVRRRAAGSARRLQLAKIPLYQIHQANPVVPDSVTMRGMRSLLDDDRIGAVGVSNYTLQRWQQADAALGRPVVSNQVQFSLAKPGPLSDLVPFAAQENRMIMAWSPLAQGLLGGRYGPDHRPGGVRAANPLFGTENLRRVAPLLDLVRATADRYDAKPAQVALAWLLAQPQVVVIPGASSVEQLEFNVAAADLDLDEDSVTALTAAAHSFDPVPAARTLVDGLREKASR